MKTSQNPTQIPNGYFLWCITLLLHVLLLSSFSVAGPILDVLAQNPAFFVSHSYSGLEIVALAVAIVIILPGFLAIAIMLVGFVSPKIARFVGAISIGALATPSLLLIGKKAALLGDTAIITLTLSGMVVISVIYYRIRLFRQCLSYVSPAALIFPITFFLSPNIASLVQGAEGESKDVVFNRKLPPIVVLVLDEFSTASLLRADGDIDEKLFPNFRKLADGASWYRNASTVSNSTIDSVASILTGKDPAADQIPTIADHPVNLFTLLDGGYEIDASETVTELCPRRICNPALGTPRTVTDTSSLARDLTLIYAHVVLPEVLRAPLPSISDQWSHFGNLGDDGKAPERTINDIDEEGNRRSPSAIRGRGFTGVNRQRQIRQFISGLRKSDHPRLSFIHTMLPHIPYQFMPNGKLYTRDSRLAGWPSNAKESRWTDDREILELAIQRYLLQVRYIDYELGKIIKRLESINSYTETLLIVTADHGVSFIPNTHRRGLHKGREAALVSVPLFIKLPGQDIGQISDANVLTIDILPTILDYLEITSDYQFDGQSILSEPIERQDEKRFFLHGWHSLPPNLVPSIKSIAAEYRALFGDEPLETEDLYSLRKYEKFLYRKIEKINDKTFKEVTVDIDNAAEFRSVDNSSYFIPLLLTGKVSSDSSFGPNDNLAFAVNGKIAAIVPVFTKQSDLRFSALIPPDILRDGSNKIRAYTFQSGEHRKPAESNVN